MSKIQLFFEDVKPIKIKNNNLKNYIKELIINELKESGDISIVFCSDNYLLNMNKEYLQHDYYTDIITFNYNEGSVISGDLFISVDRIKENAESFNTQFIIELYRVVFHGILHLVGYNDKSDKEKTIMRQKEDFYLSEVELSEFNL